MKKTAINNLPITGAFQLVNGDKLYIIRDGENNHPVIAVSGPQYTDFYIDKNATESYIEDIEVLIRSSLTATHSDLSVPLAIRDTHDIGDYKDPLEIVHDYHQAFYSHGIVPLDNDYLREVAQQYGMDYDTAYKLKDSSDFKIGHVDFSLHATRSQDLKNHWNEEEKKNMADNLENYKHRKLPKNKDLNMLLKLFKNRVTSTALFYGPSATFKTTSAMVMSILLGLPAEILSITSGTEPEDVLMNVVPAASGANTPEKQKGLDNLTNEMLNGNITPEQYAAIAASKYGTNISGAQLRYVYSVILKRFERGGIGVLDEFNLGSPSVFGSLNNMLDGTNKITTMDGRTIYKHPDFICIACINPLYKDVQDMNEAMVSRFTNVIRFFHPTERQFVELMADSLPGFNNSNFVKKVHEYFNRMLTYAEQKGLDYTLSFREISAFIVQSVRLAVNEDLESADDVMSLMKSTMINKLSLKSNDEDYESIVEISNDYADKFYSSLIFSASSDNFSGTLDLKSVNKTASQAINNDGKSIIDQTLGRYQ